VHEIYLNMPQLCLFILLIILMHIQFQNIYINYEYHLPLHCPKMFYLCNYQDNLINQKELFYMEIFYIFYIDNLNINSHFLKIYNHRMDNINDSFFIIDFTSFLIIYYL